MYKKSYLIFVLVLLMSSDCKAMRASFFEKSLLREKPLTVLCLFLGAGILACSAYRCFLNQNLSCASAGGKTYYGNSVSIENGRVIIDGVEIHETWLDTLKAYTIGLTITSSRTKSGIFCDNGAMVIVPQPCSQQDIDSAMLIKPINKLVSIALDPISIISIPQMLAEIVIDEKQQPHVEIDEALSRQLIFTTHNGTLSFSTKNNEPIKCQYDGKPLCRIYAAIKKNYLTVGNNAKVTIEHWEQLNHLHCHSDSTVSGNIMNTDELSIKINNDSSCKLSMCNLTLLKVCAANDSQASFIEDKNTTVKIQNIIVEALNDAKVVIQANIEQRLEVIAKNDANISASGQVSHQKITIANDSIYGGQKLSSKTAIISASNDSEAYLNVAESLTGSASNDSKIFYKNKPEELEIRCLNDSICCKQS